MTVMVANPSSQSNLKTLINWDQNETKREFTQFLLFILFVFLMAFLNGFYCPQKFI